MLSIKLSNYFPSGSLKLMLKLWYDLTGFSLINAGIHLGIDFKSLTTPFLNEGRSGLALSISMSSIEPSGFTVKLAMTEP